MDFEAIGKPLVWIFITSIFIYEIWMYVKGKSSDSWKRHPAKVIDVGVKVRDDEGSEESKAYIRYEYIFNGSKFKGKRVAYGDIWSRNYGESANKISGIYRGKEVNIFVNPRFPRQSVLYKGYKGSILWEVGIFIVFVAIVAKS